MPSRTFEWLRLSFHRHETKLASLLLVLGIGLAVAAPRFFSSVNLALLARSMGVLLIVSVGMLNVILAGGIDVSAGAILAVVSVLMVRLGNHGLPASVVLPLGLLAGAGLGAVNAALIAELRIPPIVATLGTARLFRGLLLEWTQGEWESSIPAKFHREPALGRTGRFRIGCGSDDARSSLDTSSYADWACAVPIR
jgi:ribose/xylose/arabinose/galactoside ABC-type transport system permease subunit